MPAGGCWLMRAGWGCLLRGGGCWQLLGLALDVITPARTPACPRATHHAWLAAMGIKVNHPHSMCMHAPPAHAHGTLTTPLPPPSTLARPAPCNARYANTVERLLELPPVRRLMVSLPAAVEAWRERLNLRADLFRTIRWVAGWVVVCVGGQGCVHACLRVCVRA